LELPNVPLELLLSVDPRATRRRLCPPFVEAEIEHDGAVDVSSRFCICQEDTFVLPIHGHFVRLQIELETVNCRLGDGGVEEAERREFRSEGVDRGVRDCFVFVDGLLERAGTNLIAELESQSTSGRSRS